MNLNELTRVDGGQPAAQVDTLYSEACFTVYTVQPGDVTRYTVVQSFDMAAAWVGSYNDREDAAAKNRVVVVHRRAGLLATAGGTSGYTREVLGYFCHLALGHYWNEPEGLKERRAMHAARQKEDQREQG